MPDIQYIHEEVFVTLQEWRGGARHANSLNPFFYLRSVRDERFRRGYWFPGNDQYLCVSFWAGGDSHNKTPNIYLDINKKTGCNIIIVSKDSENKERYFNKIVERLNQADNRKYVQRRKLWSKNLSKNYEDYRDCLWQYIDLDKDIIDKYIKENNEPEFEEFTQRFGFIDASDFDKMYSRVLKEREELIQKEQAKKNELLSKPRLPFSINKITIDNFQGIKSCNVSDLPLDAHWLFVTGENGYGKTSFLQAISLGFNDNPDLEKYLDQDSVIQLEVFINNYKDFLTRRVKGLTKEHDINFENYVLGYGPARLNAQAETSENVENRSKNPVIGLFENSTLLKNINYELFTSNIIESELFDVLQDIIKKVTKERIVEIIVNRLKREVLFREKLSNGEILSPLPINKLAAGFRNIINLVFDIFMRFKDVHHSLNPEIFFGIVLIDEIENHLHPILQKEVIETLTQVFPNIYFIATTHSPIPLLGAPKNTIILTVNRNVQDGITIERLDNEIDFPNLLPNTILTSPVFGFHDIIPISHDSDEQIRVEQTFSEVVENDRRKEKIDSFLSDDLKNEMLKLLKK